MKLYIIDVSLRLDESDLVAAKKWWKDMNYSKEDISIIAVSAALDGVINPDIVDAAISDDDDEDDD